MIFPLAFLNPWILLALLALPAIWWLLRITPPPPQRTRFPPLILLRSISVREEAAATTPWWLLLLRLLLAALVILALAGPVLNPTGATIGSGPMVIVIDNGWRSAAHWSERQQTLLGLLEQAERDARAVLLLPTAVAADGQLQPGTLSAAADSRAVAQALQPMPWPANRALAAQRLQAVGLTQPATLVWLSDGTESDADASFIDTINGFSQTLTYRPAHLQALKTVTTEADPTGLSATVSRVTAEAAETVEVRALGNGGQIIARQTAQFDADSRQTNIVLKLPNDVRNRVERVALDGYNHIGAVTLLDERWRRRQVALVAGSESAKQNQPLLSDLHYLAQALAPYHDLQQSNLDTVLAQPQSMIALANVGVIPRNQQQRLQDWIAQGGLLLRFAGPRLAADQDDLIPVRLRAGGRTLGGAMSWSQPVPLAAFPEHSPFHGLAIPEEVTIKRQVLAEPALDLSAKTWASLADGTPLVTAERQGQGWLVLFHITANGDWSNLPFSGLFVEMLQRLTQLARGGGQSGDDGHYPPLANLDGFAVLGPPLATALPLPVADAADRAISASHPPGFYGNEFARIALNLDPQQRQITAFDESRMEGPQQSYGLSNEIALKHWLLLAALILLLVDLVALLWLRGLLSVRLQGATMGRIAGAIALACFGAISAPVTPADAADEFAIAASQEIRLAYIETGNRAMDEMSRAGLSGLSMQLQLRTSVEPAAPMAVNPDLDPLIFFPLIYWPIDPAAPALSAATIARINDYMRTGGTILFDTREANQSYSVLDRRGPAGNRLQQLLRRLDVPPLIPVPAEHVLTKAYYLMQRFPGRYDVGQVWVEQRADNVNDGVSSLVIGSNDWAAAWAVNEAGQGIAAVVPGGEFQREMAYRFGINLVMYTLTGNYKADQVHVPAILERLGQ